MGLLGKIFGGKKMPLHITDENFEQEVLRSSEPVVLDVWTTNCVHCKRLEEIMVSLATKYDGQVKVCEMGAHFAPKAASALRVTSSPTVIYFLKGREKERVRGFRGSLYHRETIEEVFGIPA